MSTFDAFVPNEVFTVNRPTPNGGFGGGATLTSIGTVEAIARLESSTERHFAGRQENARTVVFLTAFGEDVTVGDQITFRGKDYRVLTVEDPNFTGDHLEVVAEEIGT